VNGGAAEKVTMRIYRTVLNKVKSIRHRNLRETNAVRGIAQRPAKKEIISRHSTSCFMG